MRWKQITISVALVAALATLPFSSADAYRGREYPLFWPFVAGAAVVGTAAAIATVPIRAVAAAPYYAPRAYYAPPPVYYAPGYYGPYYR